MHTTKHVETLFWDSSLATYFIIQKKSVYSYVFFPRKKKVSATFLHYNCPIGDFSISVVSSASAALLWRANGPSSQYHHNLLLFLKVIN